MVSHLPPRGSEGGKSMDVGVLWPVNYAPVFPFVLDRAREAILNNADESRSNLAAAATKAMSGGDARNEAILEDRPFDLDHSGYHAAESRQI